MTGARRHRADRISFERWLIANGAEPLGALRHEFVRFRAHGMLCIVYEPNRRGTQSCVPELAREAFRAWRDGGVLDLGNPSDDGEIEDFHDRGRRLYALHLREGAGERIDLAAEAASFNLTPERLRETLAAWARSAQRQGVAA